MTLMEMVRFYTLCQDVTTACVREALSPGTEAGLAAHLCICWHVLEAEVQHYMLTR